MTVERLISNVQGMNVRFDRKPDIEDVKRLTSTTLRTDEVYLTNQLATDYIRERDIYNKATRLIVAFEADPFATNNWAFEGNTLNHFINFKKLTGGTVLTYYLVDGTGTNPGNPSPEYPIIQRFNCRFLIRVGKYENGWSETARPTLTHYDTNASVNILLVTSREDEKERDRHALETKVGSLVEIAKVNRFDASTRAVPVQLTQPTPAMGKAKPVDVFAHAAGGQR
jgi:hypothetical protein